MNPIRELIIAIKSRFDGKGMEEAQKQLETTGRKAEDAGKKAEDAGKKHKESGRNMTALGSAAGRTAGLFGNLSAAMAAGGQQSSQMSGALSAVGAAVASLQAGVLGFASVILAAGINAWIKYNQKVEESKKQLTAWREHLHEQFREANEERLTRLGGQYDETKARIDALSAAYDRLAAAQAAVDSAEKAARLSDINLREKEALAAISEDPELKRKNPDAAAKQADLRRTEASNTAAQERRALEQEFEVRSAQQAVGQKEKAAGELNARADVTDREILAMKAEMARQKTLLENITKERTSLEQAPVATKQALIKPSTGPYDPAVYGPIEDTEAMQVRRDRIKQLAADEKSILGDGKEKGSYEKLADALLKLIDTRSAQQVEAKALKMESAAAERNLAIAQNVSPKMNAAESEIATHAYESQQEAANLAAFQDQPQTLRREAEQAAAAAKFTSDFYDPSKMKFSSQEDQSRAKQTDHDLAIQARKFEGLAQAAKQLEDTIKGLDPDAMTRRFNSIRREMDRIQTSLKQMEQRSKNPGFGG